MASRRSVTLGEVAREAGVSISAASFALSGRAGRRPAGSSDTLKRVQEAADRLGYVPNRHARAIRTGRSDVVSLVLGPIGDPWATSMTEAVQHALTPHHLSTVVLVDDDWQEFLSGYPSAGALVTGVGHDTHEVALLRRLARNGQPLVAYGTGVEPDGFDMIDTSPLPIVPEALNRLRARHDRVALLSRVHLGATHYRNRADAFADAVRDRGDSAEENPVLYAGTGRREAYEFTRGWLAEQRTPLAVVGGTAYLALAAQAAAHSLGLRVPDDLEIVSLGDVPEEARMFDSVSYWGVHDVFARTARIVEQRALAGPADAGDLHTFAWEYFPGSTTHDDPPATASE